MTLCPRISFSFDLDAPLEKPYSPVYPSSSDFVFFIPSDQPTQDFAIADELFSNGFILPLYSLSRAGQRTQRDYGVAPKSATDKSFKPFCKRFRRSKKASCYYYGTYKDSGAVCISPVLNFSSTCGIVSFFGLSKLLCSRCNFKSRKKTPLQV